MDRHSLVLLIALVVGHQLTALFAHMRVESGAVLDLSGDACRAGLSLSVLRRVAVDGRCIEALVVVALQSKELLVSRKLVPLGVPR